MVEMLVRERVFGPYRAQIWTDGFRAFLVGENGDEVDPQEAAEELREMADWIVKEPS